MPSPKQELWFVERTEIRGMHSACTKYNLWNPHLYLKECYLINAMCGRTCTIRNGSKSTKVYNWTKNFDDALSALCLSYWLVSQSNLIVQGHFWMSNINLILNVHGIFWFIGSSDVFQYSRMFSPGLLLYIWNS